MRREELTGRLQQTYTPERGYGVAHVPNAGYENIWFVVPPNPPATLPAGLASGLSPGVLGQANSAILRRPMLSEANRLDRLAAYLFARREAVSSSRMEGTWSTVDHALAPAGEDEADSAGERSAHASVRGYAAALEYGFREIGRSGISALTPELVCELHRRVMARDPGFGGVAGQVRTPGLPGDVVQIGGGGRREDSLYNPAPPDHVARSFGAVMGWLADEAVVGMGDAGMGFSLPMRMAIGHAHFEAVHPFSDGNGRAGRMIWPLQIVAAGRLPLFLSGYVERNRAEYSSALQEAQKQLSYGRIVAFVCDAIVASSEEEALTKSVIGALPDVWRSRSRFRKGSTAARALDLIDSMPIVTANLLSRELGVSFQAASTALHALADSGIVRERTGQSRYRVFAAEEVIAVLARPFGEDPEIALEGARVSLGVE